MVEVAQCVGDMLQVCMVVPGEVEQESPPPAFSAQEVLQVAVTVMAWEVVQAVIVLAWEGAQASEEVTAWTSMWGPTRRPPCRT